MPSAGFEPAIPADLRFRAHSHRDRLQSKTQTRIFDEINDRQFASSRCWCRWSIIIYSSDYIEDHIAQLNLIWLRKTKWHMAFRQWDMKQNQSTCVKDVMVIKRLRPEFSWCWVLRSKLHDMWRHVVWYQFSA